MPRILGKEIQFYQTANFNRWHGGLESVLYIRDAMGCLLRHPVDMLVFQTERGIMKIRSAGYPLDDPDDPYPDEETILATRKSLPTRTFWLKIDDYGDKFIGTFMLPEDY